LGDPASPPPLPSPAGGGRSTYLASLLAPHPDEDEENDEPFEPLEAATVAYTKVRGNTQITSYGSDPYSDAAT